MITPPSLNAGGFLPEGVHACDESGFSLAFVGEFPDSRTRGPIHDKFRALRNLAVAHDLDGTHWIDGSFVTGKIDPNDIDVTTFCDYDALNRLSADSQVFIDTVFNDPHGRLCKALFSTHHFLVVACGPEHPYHEVFEQARRYWRKWWGRTREGGVKGFVRMTLGRPERAPLVEENGIGEEP